MGYSSDLTDREWEIIEPLLPYEEENQTSSVDKKTTPQ